MTDTCTCPPEAGAATCAITATPQAGVCPTNGQIGKRVDSVTLKAMLALPLTQIRSEEYRFCGAADCATVYYSVDGMHCFQETDLRESVYQKHPATDDVFVCYCFRHTTGSVRAELRQTGASSVVTAITAGIQAAQCACDLRNPQGSCCLGNVRTLVAQLQREIHHDPSP